MLEAYKRAADIYSANQKKNVLNEAIAEKWIKGSGDFWYEKDVVSPKDEVKPEYSRYSSEAKAVAPLFDHVRLAELIKPWNEKAEQYDLGITIHEFDGETNRMYFSIKEQSTEFCLSLDDYSIERLPIAPHLKTGVCSPDRSYTAIRREHNLYLICNKTGKETQLTFDGCEEQAYAKRFNMVSEKLIKKEPMPEVPAVKWSPDSRYFLSYRNDTRRVNKLNLVQSDPLDGSARPIWASYPYSLPGDEEILTAQVYIFDAVEKKGKRISLDGSPLELFLLSMFDAEGDQVKWTKDGEFCYLMKYDRYFKHAQAIIISAKEATAWTAATHDYETFGFTEYFGSASQETFMDSGMLYLKDTEELIWLLEKDEYASLYLFNAKTGELKKDLTPGDYVARRIRYYDCENKLLYFSASGKEKDCDPYFQYLYCLNMTSGEIKRLTPETADHITRFSPDGRYYIDTYSTVDAAPKIRVCCTTGDTLCELASADISRIVAKGYITPEPFEAVARDGETKIYGIIVKPYGFDPNKKYPVVDYIYGGPQRINTPKGFWFGGMLESDPQGGLQTLAQLGFVGIIVDGLGTPLRSKKIHDLTYGKAEECCGIEDHVCAIKQLAEKHSWIDADRVGIWGASGGGYATTRAMLAFPEFFKVGVSLCGNHDQAKYHAHWGDRWIGPYSEEGYKNQANQNFADKLEGKLLLIHGDMDDNVHPSATMKLTAALIKANKDFDLLIYPNSNHGVGQFAYVVRRRWDYFVKHLLGVEPPKEFVVKEEKKEEEKEENK